MRRGRPIRLPVVDGPPVPKAKRCAHPPEHRVACSVVVEHNVVGLLEHTAWCSVCGAFRARTSRGWRWVAPRAPKARR